MLGLLAALSPAPIAAWVGAAVGTLVPLIYAVMHDRRLRHRARSGSSTSPDKAWIPALGIRYKLGVDGLNLWLSG